MTEARMLGSKKRVPVGPDPVFDRTTLNCGPGETVSLEGPNLVWRRRASADQTHMVQDDTVLIQIPTGSEMHRELYHALGAVDDVISKILQVRNLSKGRQTS
jgi:hypothetical protein